MKHISLVIRWNKAKRAIVLLLMVAMMTCALCACNTEGTLDTGTATNQSSDLTETDNTDEENIKAPVTEEISSETESSQSTESGETVVEKNLALAINGESVSVEWEDNESVTALRELVKDKPLTVQMSMYGGFEQVGSLEASLPRNDGQITTAAGDIVLYSGNQIVVFYGSNSWAYTRLGHVTDKTAAERAELLGNGNVTIEISLT